MEELVVIDGCGNPELKKCFDCDLGKTVQRVRGQNNALSADRRSQGRAGEEVEGVKV